MEALQAFLARDIAPHAPDRMVENFQPGPEFFDGKSHTIDSHTDARWGFDSTDSIEYVYLQKTYNTSANKKNNNSNDRPTRMRISIYDAQGLKNKITEFINELVAEGGHYSEPGSEFVTLSRFGDRNLAEDNDTAKRNAATDPDFQVGNIHGRFVVDMEIRQYKVWLMNPVSDRNATRFNNWFGPAILLSVPAMVELVKYIDIASAEIKAARGT